MTAELTGSKTKTTVRTTNVTDHKSIVTGPTYTLTTFGYNQSKYNTSRDKKNSHILYLVSFLHLVC